MSLHVYNTVSRKKESFVPHKPHHVGMYVCGVTPYDNAHLGHGRFAVSFDVIRRYLQYKGYSITYVENVTDVDDKIIKRAQETHRDPAEVAATYTEAFAREKEQLGILAPTHNPKVTEHIAEIITLVQRLIDRKFAYALENGDVYFDVSLFEPYGKLSGQPLDQLIVGARVEPDPRKRNPGDFSLWKSAKPGEPFWSSPWGAGRPGWHIECSAMSSKYLGDEFDLHGGGQDLIFPHHENEVAQSKAASGKSFAKYWLHNGMVTINGEKMSKSLGNFITLDQAFAQHSAEVIRYAFLTAHYRDPFDYTQDRVEAARTTVQRLHDCLVNLEQALIHAPAGKISAELSDRLASITTEFEQAMDDDFNTPEALKAIHALRDYAYAYLGGAAKTQDGIRLLLERFRRLNLVFGLLDQPAPALPPGITLEWIEEKMAQREQARSQGQFAQADQIRQELHAHDILLEDTLQGPRWKRSL